MKVNMFSGGIGSWAAAKRIKPDVLLFADTLIEDEDLYRFLDEAAANVGAPLIKIAEGRTPWEVFADRRFIGNTKVDLCSETLKRNFLRKWLQENCDPADTTVYLGIDWTESHRMERAAGRWAPWKVEAPLTERPFLYKAEILDQLRLEGIQPPRLYALGFPHNNCGGFCVKAGQGQFIRLLQHFPERYAEHERAEQQVRTQLGKNVSILRDRSDGKTKPLTLIQLRERFESGQQCDLVDEGGCGCAVDA